MPDCRALAVASFAAISLFTVPPARAEVIDDVMDTALSAAAVAPAPEFDLGAFVAGLGGTADADLFQQLIYIPLHDAVQAWINSDFGRLVDALINVLAGSTVIGNGIDGTELHPDGAAGGWLFGDGGHGWDSTTAGIAGGAGGAAGLFGTGGTGGAGGEDAAGGAGGAGGWLLGVGGAGGHGGDGVIGAAGGDGGVGPGLFGIGGRGGDAGNGGVGGLPTGAHPLPALGGAGGNGGLFGAHGQVGHFGTLPGMDPSSATSALGTTGGWITDGDGRVVILHGTNQVQPGKEPPFDPTANGFDDAGAAFLAANGVNAVRLGIQWAGVEPAPGVIDYAYLASIQQTVQMLSGHGIKTVLDMHQDLYSNALGHVTAGADGAPDWAVQTGGLDNPQNPFPLNYLLSPAQNHAWDAFWGNAKAPDGIGLQNHYAQMWEAVAAYFKHDSNVVGYEIMNEPWPGSNWLSTALGYAGFNQGMLTPFYNQVDAAIRAVDAHTPVYFEPSVLFTDVPAPLNLGTVEDPNSVFAFHAYCLTSELFASDIGCSWYEQAVQGFAQDYAQAHNIPALITEWGNTSNHTVLHGTLSEAARNSFGWLFWENYRLIHDPTAPPAGDNVNPAIHAAIAQPYPQAISGIPGAWSFTDHTFTFSYTTTTADGSGSFPAGSQTDIAVPAVNYPDGYHVSVTGGHVISAPNAPTLIIASDGGAGTVSVVVRPA